MIKEHLNTLIILAARAQKAGLIELNEMAPVAQAVEAAQKELKTPDTAQDNGENIQIETAGRKSKV